MPTLYERTLQLLDSTKLSPTLICHGARVPYPWLLALRKRRIKDPSVNRIQRLYEYLAEQPLEVD